MTDKTGVKDLQTFTYMPNQSLQAVKSPKRVRVFVAGRLIADSQRVILLRSTGSTPVYYFPVEDVRMDVLRPSDRKKHVPGLGEAAYQSIQLGERSVEHAAWRLPEPAGNAPDLRDYVAFEWDAMDAWFEEDEQVYAHPHDPFHRIDIRHSSRHVRVVMAEETVAQTHRPVLLFETGLPARYYIPRLDVRMELLSQTEKETRCAYKGVATHYSVRVGDQVWKDIAWSYLFPDPQYAKIKNLICFYNERLDDFYVDGERLSKPKTPWSED